LVASSFGLHFEFCILNSFLTWQLVDSAFPTGLFAHSWGLESMWQHGEIDGVDALRRFTDDAIVQAGRAVVPFVNAVFDEPATLERLDALADAFLTSAVANRASRVQGRTLLATAARVWPSAALTALQARAGRTCAHAAPLTGATFRALGVSRAATQQVVLYGTARGVLSAAVRLGIVGSYEAQRLQHGCAASLERVAQQCRTISIADLAQTAPLVDLFQTRHDMLYSRLFQS
jgi:urease accessory protein